MRLLSILIVFTIMIMNSLAAQENKKEQDKKAIKSMCGCYDVHFNFAETFQYSDDPAYQPSAVKHSRGLEWVQLVEDSENKIVMQHILIVGKPDAPVIVKHWRQDWLYEHTDLYTYQANNEWDFVQLPETAVKGQWMQKVFQVDDSPRYEGSATWVHIDGKSYWENTTTAPLPRREYTKRNDYNLTLRRNRHEITSHGWVHDQYNDKVIREAGKTDVVLAQEKGYNTYTRVADSRCKAARDWWATHGDMWKTVRKKWDEVFNRKSRLILAPQIDGKLLYHHLFSEDFSGEAGDIDRTIEAFIVH